MAGEKRIGGACARLLRLRGRARRGRSDADRAGLRAREPRQRSAAAPSNERMEFLGDSVLGFITAQLALRAISATSPKAC